MVESSVNYNLKRRNSINIIDFGLILNTLNVIETYQNSLGKTEIATMLKPVSVTVVAETNRLQSLLLCELMASYSIQSQRYCKYSEEYQGNIIFEGYDRFNAQQRNLIDSILRDETEFYLKYSELTDEAKAANKAKYTKEDFKYGIPIEDARFALSLAYSTNKEMTLTGEQIFKFVQLIVDEKTAWIFGDMGANFINQIYLAYKEKYGDYPYKSFDLLFANAKSDKNKSIRSLPNFYFETMGAPMFYDRYNEETLKVIDYDRKVDSLMRKTGAAALMCTTADKTPMEILNEKSIETNKAITERTAKKGHTSIAEHGNLSYGFVASIACYNQYIRPRHQEMVRTDVSIPYILEYGENCFKVPPTIKSNPEAYNDFIDLMKSLTEKIKLIIKNDDNFKDKTMGCTKNYLLRYDLLRQLVPMAYKFTVINTTNIITELKNKGPIRLCNKAQWEMKALSQKSVKEIRDLIGSDNELLNLAKPSCLKGGCKEGNECCGDNSNVKEIFGGNN